MSDAVQLLEEQHAEATALFMKLERLSDPVTCGHVFRTLNSKLRDHTYIEETIFYPEFRNRAAAKLGSDEVHEAVHEHREIQSALAAAEDTPATDYTFKNKVAQLRRVVEHHVQQEERTILPQAKRIFTEPELDEMALRMTKLASIHSPLYQVNQPAAATAARDALSRVGDLLGKITS